ncbi:hypothetical protein [Flavobacterium sp. FlaQc-48]|uniref:hypothetical protein n=1 Tax=Flavobacterium sp. FlaQc-48 TaxID=3374181 RepID=UPI003756A956
MKNKLWQLEHELQEFSERTKFSETDLLLFPDNFQQVHSFKIFGDDLLAIPAELIIEGDEKEFEIPLSLTSELETIEIFESEFRAEIPKEFIQIGNLNSSAEIVLLNKLKDTIHIFHVSDITDKEWLKCKLEKKVCDLNTFIENIRPQTVCCLINPKDFSEWDIFEIRNKIEIKKEDKLLKYENSNEAWTNYKTLVKSSIMNGFEIHYAPKKLKIEIKKESTNA